MKLSPSLTKRHLIVPAPHHLRPLSRIRPKWYGLASRLLVVIMIVAMLSSSASPTLTHAADAALMGTGTTLPGGLLWIGTDPWVSDHTLGFCRMDVQPDTTYAINGGTCSTAAASPGQASFDPSGNFVYVPSSSAVGQGVVRLTYNPGTRTVSTPVQLVPAQTLAPDKPAATALSADGSKLYVGFLKSGNIKRIVNPGSGTGTQESVGATSDGGGISGMVLVGNVLYLAEDAAISRLGPDVAGCSGACTAVATTASVSAPTALTYDGSTFLYVGDTLGNSSMIVRFNLTTSATQLYSFSGLIATAANLYSNLTALAFDADGNLFIADDPSAGDTPMQGRFWKIVAGAPPIAGTAPPGLKTATLTTTGATAPGGLIRLGSDIWLSDHALGLCRLDLQPNGTLAITGSTCETTAGSPGQAAYDPVAQLVYLPDRKSTSKGIVRLTYDPATRSVNTPVLLAPGSIAQKSPNTVVLDADGSLYVSFVTNDNIKKIVSPGGAPGAVVDLSVGRSSNGDAVKAIIRIGSDLYLAETTGVTRIANVASCTELVGGAPSCTAAATTVAATAPTALAYDGVNNLYIGDGSAIERYSLATGVTNFYASGSVVAGTTTLFSNISAMAFGNGLDLYVGDDPTAGGTPGTGRVWSFPSLRTFLPMAARNY